MNESVPAIAAVPTFNMANSLKNLIPQLLKQGYDKIIILDDNSNDDTSNVVEAFDKNVQYERFDTNVGSAGNRNRIISVLRKDKLPDEAIINFIDADIVFEPDQPQAAKIAQSLIKKYPKAGIVTVNILNNDGTRGAFNYGPAYTHKWLVSVFFLTRLEALVKKDPVKAQKYWDKHQFWFRGFPNPLDKPSAVKAGGVVECFTITKLGTYESLGGYDSKLRYLESCDFSRKLQLKGLESVYDPILTVRHTQVDVRGWRRYKDILIAQVRITLRYAFG